MAARETCVRYRGAGANATSALRRPAAASDGRHDILERSRRDVEVPQAGQVSGRDIVAPHQRDLIARDRGAGHELGQEGQGLPQCEWQRDEPGEGTNLVGDATDQICIGVGPRTTELVAGWGGRATTPRWSAATP